MQTDYLRYLLDIAELGSISAAAERSFITPQGVRRAIGVLESDIGYPLLMREGRSTHLTEYGQAILKDARTILEAQDRMQHTVAGMDRQTGMEQRYSIDAFFHPAVFDTNFFAPLTSSPQDILRLMRLSCCSNDEVVRKLADTPEEPGDATRIGMLALFSMNPDENAGLIATLAKRGFMVYPYLTYHDEILVSRKSQFAGRNGVTCAEVQTRPFAVVNEDLKRIVEEMIAPSYCTLVPDTGFRDRLVASNEAVSVAPSINRLASQDSAVVQVPLVDGWDVTLAFVGRTNILSNRTIKQMLSVLNSWYASEDDSMDAICTVHFVS